ncbi:hypothetical protein MRX96_049435 [Rhipicephalus microplus]
MRQYLRLGERRYLHQGLVLVCLERTQYWLGQHGRRGQHGLQLLQRQWLSRDYGKRGGRHHAWRCQKDVGPWPQVLWDDKRRGCQAVLDVPHGAWAPSEVPGSGPWHGVTAGPAGPPVSVPRELWVCPDAPCIRIGLWPRPGMYWFSRKVPCAGPAGKHARLRCRGVPDEQRTPRVEPHRGSALHRGRRLQGAGYRRGPRCGLVLGRPERLGPGGRRLPKAWSCSRCRSTASAGSVAVSAG